MVKVAELDLPITFARNANTITIDFDDNENNYDKSVSIKLISMVPSSLSEWTYKHTLQPTSILNLTGLDYGDYKLEITSTEEINNKFSAHCGKENWSFEKIEKTRTIFIEINDKTATNTRQFGGAFGGALLTSGSFTMMAASGGF